MVSNCTSWRTHYLQGRYRGGLGLLLPPNGLRGPYPHLPWALDNGAFPAYTNGKPWDQQAFEKALDWCSNKPTQPRWVVVPDVVTDAPKTFALWHEWSPKIKGMGYSVAFAAQDGMTPEDLEREGIDPDVVFVGGSTKWKEGSIPAWTEAYDRVHVGRINGLRGLILCHQHGVESTDGTGFFRGDRNQLKGLITFLEEQTDGTSNHPMYFPKDEGQPSLFSNEI
tara:strand:+ start:909 stop:1580 length:672 start_codon:yes stop_codon:yes gene_type:complete